MSKRDYQQIAAAFARAGEMFASDEMGAHLGVSIAATLVARTLANENPRFDEKRFLVACGVLEHGSEVTS